METAPACQISRKIGREYWVRKACYRLRGNLPEATRSGYVFTIDDSLRRSEGQLSPIDIPAEPIGPGPSGKLFAVDATDHASALTRARARLDRPDPLGFAFDQGQPESHCRNAYFVAMATYETFRRALGRPVAWAFWDEDKHPPLMLTPFGAPGANAYYERSQGRITFGYGRAEADERRGDRDLERFTALSSDVVAHEVTHALLDGLRPGYDFPFHPDVLAFHEAIADLVALFSRFGRPRYFRYLLDKAGFAFLSDPALVSLAPELGALVRRSGLRTLDVEWTSPERAGGGLKQYADAPQDPHERGGLLSSAVFEAFLRVVARRAGPLARLAATAEQRLLADEVGAIVTRTAGHFLAICIRALDYCPPAAITFPDYLRALVTADRLLVANDHHGYREAILDAFRRRGIYPDDVRVVSEIELAWSAPAMAAYPLPGLSIGALRYDATPTLPFSIAEIRRQAAALAQAIDADPRLYRELGLRVRSNAGEAFPPPEIASIRPTIRIGPDGYLDISIIAEITQERISRLGDGFVSHRGGATLVIDARGRPSHVVSQRIDNDDRMAREIADVRRALRRGALRLAEDGSYVLDEHFRSALCS